MDNNSFRSRLVWVDTSAFLAILNQQDEFHPAAADFLSQRPNLITSDLVISEFVSHLQVRYGVSIAKKAINFLEEFEWLKVEFLNQQTLQNVYRQYKKYVSRRVSLVDVSNIVLMEAVGIESIFAFDRRFGNIFGKNVLPVTKSQVEKSHRV